MFGGDREARERGDQAYYSLPEANWASVDGELWEEIGRLRAVLDLALSEAPGGAPPAAPGSDAVPSPTQVAFRLFEAANRIWGAVSAEEQDLRQLITTLRTALAVCWDLCDVRQAERTTVAQLMHNIRERIEDFEHDLGDLRAERRGRPG